MYADAPQFIAWSTIIHFAMFFMLFSSRPQGGASARKVDVAAARVEVTYKSGKPTVYLMKAPKKSKQGPGEGVKKAAVNTDHSMKDYADKVKSVVDPVWYNKVARLTKKSTSATTVVISIDSQGRILSTKLVESSQDHLLDNAAFATFGEIQNLPVPPPEILTNGTLEITWDFGLS